MLTFFFRVLVVAAGVWVAASLLNGIHYADKQTLFIVALVLALLNAVLKPLLIFFTLPFVVITFGLGILLINSLLLSLVGSLVPGFEVASFGSAFLGALLISLTSFVANVLVGTRKPKIPIRSSHDGDPSRKLRREQDVIDV